MLRIKIGVHLVSLRQPLKKALHTAAALGAEAVEIDARTMLSPAELSDTGARQIRKMLEDLNLRVCAVGFPTRRGYNVTADLDRRVDATKAAMRMAWRLGAPVVVNQVGRIPEKPEGPEWQLLLETLSDIGRHGQHVGAMLAARTGAESGDDLLRLLDALPPGALLVDLDPGELIVNGHSATEAARQLGPHIAHVHARDGTRDLALGRGIETPLGRGSVDLPTLLGVLEENDYRGYFTVQRGGERAEVEIGQAIQYLRHLG